jgi:ABC-type nitrate/sulfonate/bicarbonate transport system permease component
MIFWQATHRRSVLAAGLALVLWEALARVADNRLFPPASEVAEELWSLIGDGDLVEGLLDTLGKGFVGLLIGVAAGVVLGRLMAASRTVAESVGPLVTAAFPIPRLAIYPLLVVALGAGREAAILLVAIEALFPILYSVRYGFASVSERYRWLMSNMRAPYLSREAIFARAITPALVAGLRNAVPIMLVVVVVTELMLGSSGAGFMIRDAATRFEPARGLAVVVALGILGALLNAVMRVAHRRTNPWSLSLQT